MLSVWWIMRRDLAAYLSSPMGYIIMAAALAINGLCFNAWAMGPGTQTSSDVLTNFFWFSSGINAVASIFVSMRLIAEEKQMGTLVLLATSPVKDWQVVFGKFLSAVAFMGLLSAMTVYMPLLVFIHGKVSIAHLLAGYFGLMLLTSAAIALGVLSSALAPNQLTALVLGAFLVALFWLFWLISRVASPPLDEILAYLSLHDRHYRPFMRGIISIQDVVFYVSLVYVSLLAATRVLEARRWR
ncbi:MAG: ABC transporter permease [Myxococcota bacterium]